MSMQRRTIDSGKQTPDGIYHIDNIDWDPLVRFFCSDTAPELEGFAFSGHIVRRNRDTICVYRHIDTRRFLMLDDQLECYLQRGDKYVRVSRRRALANVYAGIDVMKLTTPLPRRFVYECAQNTPKRFTAPILQLRRRVST